MHACMSMYSFSLTCFGHPFDPHPSLLSPVCSKTSQWDEMRWDEMRCWDHIIRHLNEMRWDVGVTSFDIVPFQIYTPNVLLYIVCHVSLVDLGRVLTNYVGRESPSQLFLVGQCLLLGRITIFEVWLVLSLFIFSTFFYIMLFSLSLSLSDVLTPNTY